MENKIKNIIKIFLISTITLFFVKCVESGGSNPGAIPTISIKSPKSGDSVQVGKNEIKYEAIDYPGGSGLGAFEVYVDGNLKDNFDVTSDGANPILYLNVDSTKINSKISYYIIAYNNSGGAANSGTQTNLYVKKNTDPPQAPVNLFLQKISDSEVVISWDDSSDNESGFQIWRKEGGNSYKIIKELGENSISHRDFGLSPFVQYFYKVRAFNSFGFSSFSNEANSTGGSSTDAPSNLQADALGASAVRLTWIDNSSVENGFRIERRQISDENWSSIGIAGQNSQEYIDENDLLPGATYKYRVIALISNSQAISNEVSVTTSYVDVPAPSNLKATFNSSDKTVIVTWTDRTLNENGTIVERKKGSTGTFAEIGRSSTDINTFIDENLEAQVIYSYRAQHTTTDNVKTVFSNIDTAFVPNLPPLAPTKLEIVEITANSSYGLFWTYPTGEDIDGFELQIKDNTLGTDFSVFKLYAVDQIADNVLIPTPGNEFFFKIRAFRGNEFSDFSNIVSTTGGPGQFSVIATEITVDHVILQWNDSFTNEIGYRVFRLSVTASETEFTQIKLVAAGDGGDLTYQDDNVTRGITYKYKIRVVLPTETLDTDEISVTIPNF